MSAKIFVFVIASFNKPIYLDLIRYKKMQLIKYNIPHYFVFDDCPPSDYVFDEHDLFFEKDPVNPPTIYFPEQSGVVSPSKRVCPSQNPHMIRKFLKALKYINEEDYDFIVRSNLSTFINIPKLCKELYEHKNEKCMVLAPIINLHLSDWGEFNHGKKLFNLFSGTCIIMTTDLIYWLKLIDLQSSILYKHNDDTVLSYILNKIVRKTHNYFMQACNNNEHVSDYVLQNATLFRIFNYIDRSRDIIHWKYLLKNIDNIEI